MRVWLLLFLILAGCSRTAAPPVAEPKPVDPPEPEAAVPAFLNALTPQELDGGTLLLFDGATTFGWLIDGESRVEDGVLKLGGSRVTTARTTARFASSLVKASIGRSGHQEGEIPLNHSVTLPSDSQFKEGKFYRHGWQHEGSKGTFSLPKERVFIESYATSPPVSTTVPAGTQLWLRNVKLAMSPSLDKPTPIKTWTPLPGSEAVFADAADGWKVLQGGAVRSKEEIPHFVLQLQGKLTGATAHAEIVVRAQADRPGSGLAFTLQAGADGKLDVGSLAGKQKARQSLARVGEPFYLTLLVCENDLAAWVNGIQVIDWSSGPVAKQQDFPRAPVILRVLAPGTELCVRNVRYGKVLGDRVPFKAPKAED
jgi:hypothetical protein